MLTADAIVATATPADPLMCGIYFLIRAGQVVYVGQSVNITVRLASHATMRQFDSWAWVPCERSNLNVLERAYIDALMPEENLDSTTRRVRWETECNDAMREWIKPEEPRPLPTWPVSAADLETVDNSDAEAEYTALCERMARLRRRIRSGQSTTGARNTQATTRMLSPPR